MEAGTRLYMRRPRLGVRGTLHDDMLRDVPYVLMVAMGRQVEVGPRQRRYVIPIRFRVITY